MTQAENGSDASSPIALGLLYLLAAAWILPGLIGRDPWKPDEAYTFGVVYSMLTEGHWLIPMLAQEPFVEAPPLFYWSAAGVAWLLAPPLSLHDAARLVSGIYMALTFAFIAAAAGELYGSARKWV